MSHFIRAVSSVLYQKINMQEVELLYNDKSAMRPTSSRVPQASLRVGAFHLLMYSHATRRRTWHLRSYRIVSELAIVFDSTYSKIGIGT
jgi:hypothetical protein